MVGDYTDGDYFPSEEDKMEEQARLRGDRPYPSKPRGSAMPNDVDIVERLRVVRRKLEPLTRQGEDYIWRPCSFARGEISDAIAELERLRGEAKAMREAVLEEAAKTALQVGSQFAGAAERRGCRKVAQRIRALAQEGGNEC